MTGALPRVIEGCQDVWEELALAFCRASEQAASDLVRRQELVERRNAVKARLPEAESTLARATESLAAVTADHARVTAARGAWLLVGASGLVALIALVLLAFPETRLLGSVLFLAAAGTAAAAGAAEWRKRRQARDAVTQWEQEVARRYGQAEALRREADDLAAEIRAVQPRSAVRAVGRVYFPATVTNVGGFRVALDRSGAIPESEHRLADFTYDTSELAAIVSAIDHLRHPPVMLQPADGEGGGDVDALFGEEVLLRDTVARFARFVGSVPTTTVALPLVPAAEVARTGFRLEGGNTLPFPGAVLEGTRRGPWGGAIRRLNETLGSVRQQGAAPKEELRRSYSTIAALLAQYRELRTTSVGKIHEQLIGAMDRSSWCAVHFYCPKSTRNPAWIQRRLGVDVEAAHEMPQDELMRALLSDEEVRERVDARPEIVERLDRAWIAMDELAGAIESLRSAAMAAAAGVGVAAGPGAATYSGAVRSLESQREQLLRQYRDALREIIFGTRRPLLEMPAVARLTLDPVTGTWTNETAGTSYADVGEIECTQVLRLHEDLLFPIWRHLWTEKADFRKSELFRTNEGLLRLSEKESEKLISVGNQFRDDMRTTREVLKQVEGELKGKLDQMRGTRDALKELGLLGREGARTLGEESLSTLDVGATQVLRQAEVRETMLALEPQAQTERRERATDPIDAIASPSVLFRSSPAEWFRARVVPGRATGRPEATLVERVVAPAMTDGQ